MSIFEGMSLPRQRPGLRWHDAALDTVVRHAVLGRHAGAGIPVETSWCSKHQGKRCHATAVQNAGATVWTR